MKKKFTSLLVFVLLISMVLPAGTSFAAGKKPKLNMKKLNMTVGSTFSLRVYNAKKKHKITFTSSKPSIATVKTETQNARYASVSALAIGSSVITVTVKKGKKVIAVPRLAKYGEHVDDHQLQLLHQFDDLQLICACYDVEQLGECYKNLQNMHFRPYVSNTSVVIASIDEYLQSLE